MIKGNAYLGDCLFYAQEITTQGSNHKCTNGNLSTVQKLNKSTLVVPQCNTNISTLILKHNKGLPITKVPYISDC